MKLLLTITSVLLSFLILPQDVKLKGKYKMEYEPEYKEQNCIINFKGTTYERRLTSGKVIKGKILYGDLDISLFDKKTNLQMDFLKQDIQKDTIYFGTKNVSDKPEKEGEMIIYSGRLIKMK